MEATKLSDLVYLHRLFGGEGGRGLNEPLRIIEMLIELKLKELSR